MLFISELKGVLFFILSRFFWSKPPSCEHLLVKSALSTAGEPLITNEHLHLHADVWEIGKICMEPARRL